MTADDGHGELVSAWAAVFDVMDRLPQRIRSDDTTYLNVMDMADRVRGLATHLDSALGLAAQMRYESALVLIRTRLEQCAVDWLLFLGKTFVQQYTGVDGVRWRKWQRTGRQAPNGPG